MRGLLVIGKENVEDSLCMEITELASVLVIVKISMALARSC